MRDRWQRMTGRRRFSRSRAFCDRNRKCAIFSLQEDLRSKGYVKRPVMRAVTATFLAALAGIHPQAAHAQDIAPTPPIAPADMFNYCVYGGLVHSVGSQICIVRGGPALYCDQRPADTKAADARNRASWTTNQPPGTINCTSEPAGPAPNRPYR
jgi:hypothetical protein